MLGNAPYSGLISGANIVDESIGASALKVGLLSGVKNRIINGDMRISQRGTSFAAVADASYTVDRYLYGKYNASAVTITQNSDVPANSGLSKSLRIAVTTADTAIAAGEYSVLMQSIEGYNVADLVGNSFTVSFWVRSSKIGVHNIVLRNGGYDNTYVSKYSVISADTWEKKIITVQDGLPSSGTWNFIDGAGLRISWVLASGTNNQTTTIDSWITSTFGSTADQVNCLDTVGNIFAITGVQLEKGSSATDFEFRPYQFELDLCSRYYETTAVVFCFGGPTASNDVKLGGNYRVHKRVTPTITTSSITGTVSSTYTDIHNFQVNFSSGVYNNFSATVTAVAEL